MAEDLNNIFQDFENKSVEELGSSLLGRQAEINKKQAKEAKKGLKGVIYLTIQLKKLRRLKE